MELKTDKIHRILNTPYDELRPQDFSEAQDQLEALRWREHAVTVENLETALAGTKAERDQFKGICERLKRELEEAKSDIMGAQMATLREYDGVRDDLYKARVRITDLETQVRDERGRATYMEIQAQASIEERDRLSAELDDERQKPSGTAKQAKRIRELEDKLATSVDPEYHAKLVADLANASRPSRSPHPLTADRRGGAQSARLRSSRTSPTCARSPSTRSPS